jgi:CHAT domain-containing protein
VQAARTAVQIIESMRGSLATPMERTHFLNYRTDAYQTLAAAMMANDPSGMSEVFRVVDAAHARSLREVLQEKQEEVPAPVDLNRVQRHLRPGELVVEYLLGTDDSLLLVVSGTGVEGHILPGRAALTSRIKRYRRVLERPGKSVDARLDPEVDFRRFGTIAHELFRDLLGPVADRLDDVKHLIVVPDRHLHLIPFEALLLEPMAPEAAPAFLGADLAVSYLPAGAFLSRRSHGLNGNVLLVQGGFEDPEGGFPALRHAEDEMEAIQNAWPSGRVVTMNEADATAEGLAGLDLGRYGCMHVIAHATSDSVDGPRIMLSRPQGEPAGSILDSERIASLRSPPSVVVLSACRTGQGEIVGGEGILGMVRAFTLAGSNQVVASLWSVDDARTARIMGRFHEALHAGERPSEALRTARGESIVPFVHPYYWSAFVLYGADG